MIKFMLRLVFAAIIYEIGLFYAIVGIISTLFRTITGGRKGIIKLFNRGKHEKQPEIALVGYDHDYVRTRSGTRFHYVHAGDPENPLMLCLHGFPECWYSWRCLLKNFCDDYYVIAVDMKGYGESDKPKSIGHYHMHYMVRDVQEMIRALGYQNAVLVGHDWGGLIAWDVARYYPDVVSKLVIMNAPPPDIFRKYIAFRLDQFLKSWYIFLFQIPWLPEFLWSIDDFKLMADFFRGRGVYGMRNKNNAMSDDEIEIYKNAAFRNLKYTLNYYRAGNPIYTGLGLKPKAKYAPQPCILIWGNKDAALDLRLVDATKNAVKQVKTVIIDGASHWVQLDEPEKVVEAMKEFLSSA